jgi:DNA-directed RNA polymerase I, II, and III subunit RPABC5
LHTFLFCSFARDLSSAAMIIPIRCFTCGKVIANKYKTYMALKRSDMEESEILDTLGLPRYCCRRMMLGHVDLIDKLLKYNAYNPSNTPIEG